MMKIRVSKKTAFGRIIYPIANSTEQLSLINIVNFDLMSCNKIMQCNSEGKKNSKLVNYFVLYFLIIFIQ